MVGFTEGVPGQGFGMVPGVSRDQEMISQGPPSALPGQRLHREGQGAPRALGIFKQEPLERADNSHNLPFADGYFSLVGSQFYKTPGASARAGWGKVLF